MSKKFAIWILLIFLNVSKKNEIKFKLQQVAINLILIVVNVNKLSSAQYKIMFSYRVWILNLIF